MQNLPLPHIPVQEAFYIRQLRVYAFETNNLKTMSHFYHEGQDKRGPNEIRCLLLDYITNHISETTKELNFFLISDSCPCQNRNHTVVRFFANLAANGIFTKIFQYFHARGHYLLPCDTDFGLIKKVLHKTDKVTRIY
jgi:hypothetical protein